jgi:hypothetical protein
MKNKSSILEIEATELENTDLTNTEKIIEKIIENYSVFEEIYQNLATLKAFNSTCVIKIRKIKEIMNRHFPFAKFGFLERDIMKDRLDILNEMLAKLTPFEKDFVLMRYFERKTRSYVVTALKIGSVSTYKRRRHVVLEHCREILYSNERFYYLFSDFINYIEA